MEELQSEIEWPFFRTQCRSVTNHKNNVLDNYETNAQSNYISKQVVLIVLNIPYAREKYAYINVFYNVNEFYGFFQQKLLHIYIKSAMLACLRGHVCVAVYPGCVASYPRECLTCLAIPCAYCTAVGRKPKTHILLINYQSRIADILTVVGLH